MLRATTARRRALSLIVPALGVLLAALGGRPSPADATIASHVSIGEERSCVLDQGGGVQCWGRRVGDGADDHRVVAVGVTGAASDIASIAIGDGAACLVTTGGQARCWGDNASGELGDGTTQRRLAPVDVVGLPPVTAIGPGFAHSCAVTTAGAAKCWGNNDDGQLGDGTTTDSLAPVDVSGLSSGVAAIAAGSANSCALTTGGGVKCWGNNASGGLGDGTNTHSPTPVDVVGLSSGVVALAPLAGAYCALTGGGGVKCWGFNGSGQLGDGTTTDRNAPVDVSGLASGVAAIGGGAGHACAVTTGGAVRCWGSNDGGQLGDGTTTPSASPVGVVGLEAGMAGVDGGDDHTCARTATGAVKCWGRNGEFFPGEPTGELGDGTEDASATPVDVVGFGPTICPNPVGERNFADSPRPRVVASRIGADTGEFNDRLMITAQLALPAGITFAMLAPLTQGARLQLHAASGAGLVDVRAAAGTYAGSGTHGWRSNASGSTWTFTDRTGSPRNGLTKVQLVDRSRGAPGGNVKLVVTGQGGRYPVTSASSPIQATLVVGDDAAGLDGRCGVSAFGATDCRFNPAETTLTCRR